MTEEAQTKSVVTEPVVEPAPVPESVIETPPASEPVTEPQNPEPAPTAQPIEPLNIKSEIQPETNPASAESSNVATPEPASAPTLEPQQVIIPPIITKPDSRSLLVRARDLIQFRKRKKLEKIMAMFLKQSTITNDQVEKLLHVSDATATRYLQQLEKEGKIRQTGRTGTGVSYSRM